MFIHDHISKISFGLIVINIELTVFVIVIAVCFGNLSYYFAGIADSYDIIGNVFGDDASRADHDVIADMDAGQDDGISADPDVIADRDVDSVLVGCVAGSGVDRMACRIDGDAGGDLTVVADHYFADIDDGAVVVAEEILADFNIETVVAVKRRIDKGALRLAEQFLDDSADPLEIRAVHRVELLGEAAGALLLFKD